MEKQVGIVHVCYSANSMKDCKFPWACYGEICVSPKLCMKDDSELTTKEKKSIRKFEKENGLHAPPKKLKKAKKARVK